MSEDNKESFDLPGFEAGVQRAKVGHTAGPWFVDYEPVGDDDVGVTGYEPTGDLRHGWEGGPLLPRTEANETLKAAAPSLLEALHEGRRAIGDHWAPNDCYATGPVTGNEYRDLVECPACSFIAAYDAAIAKATGADR